MENYVRKIIKEELTNNGSCSSSSSASASSRNAAANHHAASTTRSAAATSRINSLISKINGKGRFLKKPSKPATLQLKYVRCFDDIDEIVTAKCGGGTRFTTLDDPGTTFETLMQKAISLFFVNGRNNFDESIEGSEFCILDCGQNPIDNELVVMEFMKERGLYPSKTYFFLKSNCTLSVEEKHLDRRLRAALKRKVCSKCGKPYCGESCVICDSDSGDEADSLKSQRQVCGTCGGTYFINCLKCQQDREFKATLEKDRMKVKKNEEGGSSICSDYSMLGAAALREKRIKFLHQSHTSLNGEDKSSPNEEDFKIIVSSDEEDPNETIAYSMPLTEEHVIKDADEQLVEMFDRQKDNGEVNFRIVRERSFVNFEAYLKKPWVSCSKKVKIIFIGEACVDNDGPRREFFSECLKQAENSLFDNGYPLKSIVLLENRSYFAIGRLMALTMIQGGPKPTLLSEVVYKYLSSVKHPSPTSYPIPESFLSDNLVAKKLLTAETDDEFAQFLSDDPCTDLLTKIGYSGLLTKETLKNRMNLLKLYYFKLEIEPLIPALQQITEGLDIDGFLECLRQCSETLKDCFVKSRDLSVDVFMDLIDDVEFSAEGSNKHAKEVQAYKNLCDAFEMIFLDENCIIKPQQLLQFLTGSPSIPRLGFGRKVKVIFLHDCLAGCRCRPVVSTCELSLTLPMHCSNDALYFVEAIQMSYGFGRV